MGPEDLMLNIVAAFEKSDLQPLLDALHEDIVWKTASRQQGLFSFHGEYRNRAGVTEVLAQISKDYTFQRIKPKEVISARNVVWGLFDVEVRYDPKGETGRSRKIDLEIAVRWRLSDGKIIEHQVFFDTAYLLAEQQKAAQAGTGL